MKAAYKVKTPVFEGPLELLLELVTERKLFVNDVSLSEVADDFIRYIETHEEFPISESAEFIVVASTLMLIKSRSLLPSFKLTEEEEESIHDLEDRLALYARTKELAAGLGKLFGKNIIFEKLPQKNAVVVFSPDSKTDTTNLLAALEVVIESLPKETVLPKVLVKKVISLEEMIEKLATRISQASKLSFKDFHGVNGKLTYEKKVSIIVGFLAMLELVKRGAIRVAQDARGNIDIETEELATPNYSN
ncbi:MAG: hypothetical protein A2832_00995 [Candidatus Zambryskibacteria bacterium RIFCSPHIGHO2_01_FULL_44_22b]|uniref:Segregation and condensation protein A n=1 Tax=Candidatus Zambryskibacteria bacterium RIFCSPHIGHO2_01_FULL_44_22b TaxID=1802737 RepID=A0A1G2SZQ2_9BACT|nr:MAG: hypothetical protein A2832_00995 [Candidatus Zambryskibacteria bacterium RIFCSPHIGHO2_01_FULL_44_22b]